MVFEPRSILVLGDGGWLSLLGLIVMALLAWLAQAMKKDSPGDTADEAVGETVLEIDMSELLGAARRVAPTRGAKPPAARPVPPPPKVELASVVRATARTAPLARRSVVAHEPDVAPPLQPQLPASRMRSVVRGLATESPASLRRWVMAMEVLAPPVALRRVPGPARDWLGVP